MLTAAERQLLVLTRKKTKTKDGVDTEELITLTYAALDRVRRNVGDGFGKRSGPFKDDNAGTLRQVYRVLSEDQQGVASALGVGETYTAARAIVAKRKVIEDQAVELFGKTMADSLVPKIRTAAVALTKGDVSKFNKLMNALPEARRTEVAATLLNDIFASGSRRGGELSGSFAASFNALNKNKVAKTELFKHLPAGAEKRFDDIGRVFGAIIRANQKPLSNPSGSAAPIIAALEKNNVLAKIYSAGGKIVVAEAVSTTISLPGAGTAGVIGSILAKPKIPAVVAADEFLNSTAFSKAIGESLAGDVIKANKSVAASPVYKAWLGTLDRQQQQRIASTGFIGWLVSEDN